MSSRTNKSKPPPSSGKTKTGKSSPGTRSLKLSTKTPKGGSSKGAGAGRWVGRAVGALFLGLVVFVSYSYASLPDAEPLLKQNPKTTALIDQRAAEAREANQKPRRRQTWVSLSNVSKHAIAAVVLSEDASFFLHEGVDTKELENALDDAIRQGKLGRGASTITQQLAKNLWLSTDRSLLRKAKELLLTRRLEKALPKNRILSLYLNVVEWGSGVYGIEAGAREHFGVSAAELSPAQGALLASMLPAPRRRSPASGSPALKRRAHWVIEQMQGVKRLDATQAQAAHAEIDALMGGRKADAAGDDEET